MPVGYSQYAPALERAKNAIQIERLNTQVALDKIKRNLSIFNKITDVAGAAAQVVNIGIQRRNRYRKAAKEGVVFDVNVNPNEDDFLGIGSWWQALRQTPKAQSANLGLSNGQVVPDILINNFKMYNDIDNITPEGKIIFNQEENVTDPELYLNQIRQWMMFMSGGK